jgi:hypothetical protein
MAFLDCSAIKLKTKGRDVMKKKLLCTLALAALVGIAAAGCGSSVQNLNFSDVKLETFYETMELTSLRPLTAAPDGSALYGGYIKSDSPEKRGIAAYSTSDGKQKWIYYPGYNSYTKGVAADDRGNVYVGIAHAPSENTVSIDIVSSDGKKISSFDINESGEFGVNGLAVYKNGKDYTLYIVTNYGPNRIYAYNVTDTSKAVADTSFGINGVVNLKSLTGNEKCEGNYIKADTNGDLYLTANLGNGNKGDCVLKITSNGTKVEKAFECSEAYGIDMANGYIFVSTYEGAQSHVYAFKQSDYSQAMKLDALADSENYAGVAYAGGKLYISDQGYKGGARILMTTSLTGK